MEKKSYAPFDQWKIDNPHGSLNDYYSFNKNKETVIPLKDNLEIMEKESFYISPMIKLFIACILVIVIFKNDYIGEKISLAKKFIVEKINTTGTTDVEIVYTLKKPERENRKRINAAGDYKTLDEIAAQSISQYPHYTAKGSMFNSQEDEYANGTFYIFVDVAQEKHYIDKDEENGKFKHLKIIIWTYFVKQGENYKTFFSQTQQTLFIDNEKAEHYTQMMVEKYVSDAKSFIVYKTNMSKKDFDFKTIDGTLID